MPARIATVSAQSVAAIQSLFGGPDTDAGTYRDDVITAFEKLAVQAFLAV